METFRGYYWRVMTRVGKDAYAWARDNVVIAGCIAVVPPIAAYIQISTEERRKVEAAAKASKQNVSAWIRSTLAAEID
jgi:hypothetical protein